MSRPRLIRSVCRASALALPAAVLFAAAWAGAGAGAANPPGSHDPYGAVDTVSAPSRSSLQFVGWAADPDDRSRNLRVAGYLDGHWVSGVGTDESRPWVTGHRHTGSTPGFTLVVAVPSDGRVHTVCAAARSIGSGIATILKCVATPLGTRLDSNQVSAHNPHGAVSWVSAWTGTLHVVGWSTDPDLLSRRSVVVVYVDGSAARTVTTSRNGSVSRPSSAGPYSSYDVKIPVASGTHMACVWAVNVGFGSGNILLGCKGADTRRPAGTGPVRTPSANRTILAEAVKHRGQPYVWAAEGPRSFDCSGLVQYSYAKAHVSTPRVSGDQFRAAYKIPASRAVPGDLVFWYDSVANVHHVGIYVRPGLSFAAIDTAEGINYQSLTWTTSLSYGSFTHT